MYVHFRATQSMNQEFKFKTAQNSKECLCIFVIKTMLMYFCV